MSSATHPAVQERQSSFIEFVILMALMMSLVALSIDSILPALDSVAGDFQLADPAESQFVVSMLFLGLTVGQLIYGPLSDSLGRKRALYIGLGFFMAGSLISLVAQSFAVLLIGRLIQGFGAASGRIITLAMVRDRFEGRDMAKVMSIVMGVFILVPAIAPSLGQGVLFFSDWRGIFVLLLVLGACNLLLLRFRLAESLPVDSRRAFSLPVIWAGIKEVVTTPVTLGYTIAAGMIFGGFVGYLSSAQLIFQGLYDTGNAFALLFGLIALTIGGASFSNSMLVRKFGMRTITKSALAGMVVLSALFVLYELGSTGVPALPVFVAYAMATFFCIGLMFGNINAMAMEPMGHMAGLASAVVGSVSTGISVSCGTVIGILYNESLLPLSLGLLLLSLTAGGVMFLTERTRTAQPQQ